MPNCWDRKPNGPVRKMLVDEMKTFKKLDSIIFSSPVDGGEDWKGSYQDLKWIGDIPGATMIELPGHNTNNGREISVNGKLCRDLQRMHGGWEEVWPEGKEKPRRSGVFRFYDLERFPISSTPSCDFRSFRSVSVCKSRHRMGPTHHCLRWRPTEPYGCLLYTSDAADE